MIKTKKKNFKMKIMATVLIIAIIFIFIFSSATNVLINVAVSEFEASISTAVYQTLNDDLLNDTDFREFFHVIHDNNGNVAMISTDSFRVNLLSDRLSENSCLAFEKICDNGVEIPLGVFTGFRFFSGFGKKIRMKLINVVSVKCEFLSVFESSGINQTRQSLYLVVEPEVCIVVGLKKIPQKGKISILVFDNLIVGKVPEYYLNAKIIGGSS